MQSVLLLYKRLESLISLAGHYFCCMSVHKASGHKSRICLGENPLLKTKKKDSNLTRDDSF